MAKILVVEDSPTQAVHIQIMLEKAGYEVAAAKNGVLAMEAIESDPPDVVLTDLHMPEMNGLEVVKAVREKHPRIPVVMMTADGSEDIAAEALKAGAANYIPKRILQDDLAPTMAAIVQRLGKRHKHDRVADAVVESATTFEFGNDHEFAEALVSHLESELQKISDETGVFRIVLALKEAVINAIDHGNLELNSKLRDEADTGYWDLGNERREQEPWCKRRVRLTSRIEESKVTYVIRDEGPGFDPSLIPDPSDPENLVKAHGRGLVLIQSFMDEVHHNETGNEITMVKHRDAK